MPHPPRYGTVSPAVLIDLHTHTQPLSHDSLLSPDDLIEAAKAAGLDAVCLTEHDFTWDPQAVRELARRMNSAAPNLKPRNSLRGAASPTARSAPCHSERPRTTTRFRPRS